MPSPVFKLQKTFPLYIYLCRKEQKTSPSASKISDMSNQAYKISKILLPVSKCKK